MDGRDSNLRNSVANYAGVIVETKGAVCPLQDPEAVTIEVITGGLDNHTQRQADEPYRTLSAC